MKTKSQAVVEREVLQQNVMRLYRDVVILARKDLCSSCRAWRVDDFLPGVDHPVCEHNLLPITSRGEQCPYFDRI